jgi:hypothetical protein
MTTRLIVASLFDSGIRPAVDKWLLDKSKEERNYGDYWSASSAGYCHRKVIFERLGVPKIELSADARKQRVFTSGHIFHSWIQEITREAGLSVAQEIELQDEGLMVRGHIDDLVLINDKLMLIDYKTQNSRAFSYKRPDMSHYHRLQLGTYMYMLRKEQVKRTDNGLKLWKWSEPELTEARILKISKDDLRMVEEQLMWTPDLEKDVVGYWRTLNGYWESKKLPRCTCADYEGGFLAKEAYNGFYYNGEPCSLEYYKLFKEGKLNATPVQA